MARRRKAAEDAGRLAAAGDGRFELSGEIGFDDAARLLAAGDAAFGSLQRAEIDLARVTRADSAGLALLVGWIADARARGVTVAFRGVPQRLHSIAKISEVDGLLTGSAA